MENLNKVIAGRKKEDMCGTCEYNLEMIHKYHIAYLPDTCPRRSSGECPELRGSCGQEEAKLYTKYRGDTPVEYRYGPPWKAMQLMIDGGYKTPEEAKAAWEQE